VLQLYQRGKPDMIECKCIAVHVEWSITFQNEIVQRAYGPSMVENASRMFSAVSARQSTSNNLDPSFSCEDIYDNAE
jgi:hypothetical protein